MAVFEDRFYWSNDGVRLHYRAYAGRADRPIILCIPGLLRNARDFEPLAARLAGEWRLWCLDLRGRGDSGYAKDPLTYAPATYLQDIIRLIDETKAGPFVFFGTSLGGILTMLMAGAAGQHIAGALLNDVGPELAPAGLERIRGYVGKVGPWPTWMHAAWAVRDLNAAIFPHYGLEDWLAMAKRLCCLQPNGRVVMDYDPRIAEPFKTPSGPAGVDLWPSFEALGGVPLLSVRGETSDIITAETQNEMQWRLPGMHAVTVPGVGHAPALDEPVAMRAIKALLTQVVAYG